MSVPGPTLTTCAVRQVVRFREYTCRQANVVVTAARDPKPPFEPPLLSNTGKP
jgi:hypothetical protein